MRRFAESHDHWTPRLVSLRPSERSRPPVGIHQNLSPTLPSGSRLPKSLRPVHSSRSHLGGPSPT
ncbi:hypothetical protein OF83DRAFT_1153787 [Amylostereum chailletii]|nr:hypothetical protein OF83DRAFT_1153787 [Amylostereum chailletii]